MTLEVKHEKRPFDANFCSFGHMIVCSLLIFLHSLHNGELQGNVPELSLDFDDGNLLLVRICFKLEGCLYSYAMIGGSGNILLRL